MRSKRGGNWAFVFAVFVGAGGAWAGELQPVPGDVPTGHWARPAVEALANRGLLAVFFEESGEGTAFAPAVCPSGRNPFSDVPRSHWAYEGVVALVDAGII